MTWKLAWSGDKESKKQLGLVGGQGATQVGEWATRSPFFRQGPAEMKTQAHIIGELMAWLGGKLDFHESREQEGEESVQGRDPKGRDLWPTE